MKLNISLPATSCQKLTEVDGEHRLHTFYEKYMAIEVAAKALGEEWKVYGVQTVWKIPYQIALYWVHSCRTL